MPQIEFSELPSNLRVKLTEEGEKELWNHVGESGGIKDVSNASEFSKSKMYNWKNKDLAVPVKFVKRMLGRDCGSRIVLLKGKSSSSSLRDPEFPLQVSDELLTRVDESVKLNSDGLPFYLTGEKTLVDRFSELLNQLGMLDYSIYSRESRFELRYPKFVHNLLSGLDYQVDKPALVDESGEITKDQIKVGEEVIEIEEVEGKLYSRVKKFEVALQKEDSGRIADMMAEESAKVRSLVGN